MEPVLSLIASNNTQTVFNKILQYTDETKDTYIEFDFIDKLTRGLKIKYDCNTIQSKEFRINENGVYWSDGINKFNTKLSLLAVLVRAFQAVELPSNATTLQINDTLYLTNGSSATAKLNTNSLSFVNGVNTSNISMTSNDFIINSNGSKLLLNSGNNEFYIGQYSNSNAPCIVSTGNSKMTLNINSRNGVASIGDCDNSFNLTKLFINDNSKILELTCQNPVVLNKSASIKYSNSYYNTNQLITNSFAYALTFNGFKLTATLPYVDSSNVGIQYLITNINNSYLTVSSTSGQYIYSSVDPIAPALSTYRMLASGYSFIFTAIRTTSNTTYGWIMV